LTFINFLRAFLTNSSIVSVINDFIKMYCYGVRFMLQSQVKDWPIINNTQNRIKRYTCNLFCKQKALYVLSNRGGNREYEYVT
jgi:hypothetical protein